jgi:cholesterol oxidase
VVVSKTVVDLAGHHGPESQSGVSDTNHQVIGYHGMYVVDGSVLAANVGVNPSFPFTALAERAMSKFH